MIKHYSIYKNKELVGIGYSKEMPQDCKTYTYKKLTKVEYNKLNKKVFNAK